MLFRSQESYTENLSNAQSALSQTQATATQEIIISVVATSLIVLFMMLYTVRERTKEIGTFKAIGFSNANVMSQFLLEGVLLSLMAGVVGIAIGYVAAPTLSSILLPSVNLFGGSSSGGFRYRCFCVRWNNYQHCYANSATHVDSVRRSSIAMSIGQLVSSLESSQDKTCRGDAL